MFDPLTFDTTQTVDQAFRGGVQQHPRHPAVIFLGERLGYAQLDRIVDRLAQALYARGLRPGDRAVVYMPHCPQWLVAWLALMRLQAVAVPVTHFYGPIDLEYIVNDSGAKVIFCMDTNFGYVEKVRHDSALELAVVSTVADLLPAWKRSLGKLFNRIPEGKWLAGDDTVSFPALLKRAGPPLPRLQAVPGAPAEILYTGGTTGHPKGVPIPGVKLLEAVAVQRDHTLSTIPAGTDVVIQGAPLYHILGQTVGFGALFGGDTLVLLPRMNLDAVMEHIARHRATTFFGTPTLFRMILDHDRLGQYDLSSLVYCFSAGDALPTAVARRWEEAVGRRVLQGYGATETTGGVALSPIELDAPEGSVGRKVPTQDLLFVDPDTLEPDPEQLSGELLVSSEHMVREYWNKPEETELYFVEIDGRLWYRTGDIMRVDGEGWMFFMDRSCDIIKHKGYRVAASKVEACLQEHEAVIGSCCVGIPDEMVGERIKAFVVLKEDAQGVAAQELMRWCKDRLAAYEVPAYIEFRDMLPKSKVGKLLRRELRADERRKLDNG